MYIYWNNFFFYLEKQRELEHQLEKKKGKLRDKIFFIKKYWK